MWFITSQHQKNVLLKQKQRSDRIEQLTEYHKELTDKEKSVLNNDVPGLVKLVKAGELKPIDVLRAFGKQALKVHKRTNALTEVMISDAERWAENVDISKPLAGIPVSLKDPFIVEGYDASAGYSKYVNKPYTSHGATTQLLIDAGAIPYVKTNVPITMMAIEGYNDIFGRTTNFYNPKFAPGGSSQGEGSLIAGNGSKVGIGSDIGGSVRVPAAWSGIYSLKMSNFRWPMEGDGCGYDGFQGVQVVTSPMAYSLKDLKYFTEAVFSMRPWEYDFRLIPLPWRDVKLPVKPRVGVMTLNDLLPPTPAQARALRLTKDALAKNGCEIVDFKPPSPSIDYDVVISKLYYADAFKGVTEMLLPSEHNDVYVKKMMCYVKLPRFMQVIWESLLALFGFKESANMYRAQRSSSAAEYMELCIQRDIFRKEFNDYWNREKIDFLITPPHASPAVPNEAVDTFRAVLYTSLFNLLDYPAGIVPVSRVDKTLDRLPQDYDRSSMSYPSKVTFDVYDPEEMEGLPTAVQVVTKRYQEEKALAAMELVVESLAKVNIVYK